MFLLKPSLSTKETLASYTKSISLSLKWLWHVDCAYGLSNLREYIFGIINYLGTLLKHFKSMQMNYIICTNIFLLLLMLTGLVLAGRQKYRKSILKSNWCMTKINIDVFISVSQLVLRGRNKAPLNRSNINKLKNINVFFIFS